MKKTLGEQKNYVGHVIKNLGGPASVFCDMARSSGGQKNSVRSGRNGFCDVSGVFCDTEKDFFGMKKSLPGALDATGPQAGGGVWGDEAKVCGEHALGVLTRGWFGSARNGTPGVHDR